MFDKPINRWWTVVAGALGSAAGAGVVAVYVLGVFIKSISDEFSWDRSSIAAGISFFYLFSGIGCVALGYITSKWSIRLVTIFFVIMFSLSMISVGILPKSFLLFCIAFCSMGFFGAAATPMPYAIAISRQFDRNRGTALALMVSGTAVGALLLPIYANFIMENQGWRAGYIGIGSLVGLVALAGLIFFFRTPPPDVRHQASDVPRLRDLYLSGGPFWLIGLSILFISIALAGLITNLAPLLTDRGVSSAKAALLIGLVGGASFISRLGVGILLDYIHAKFIAAGIFLVAAAGACLFLADASGAAMYLAALCIGIGIGAEADLISYMMSRYFPAASLSRALGAVWIFWAWGNGVGVFVGSLSYDLTGNYDAALMLFTGLALLSGVVILRLGAYSFPPHSAASPPKGPDAAATAYQPG